jgi:hypothetical protein
MKVFPVFRNTSNDTPFRGEFDETEIFHHSRLTHLFVSLELAKQFVAKMNASYAESDHYTYGAPIDVLETLPEVSR